MKRYLIVKYWLYNDKGVAMVDQIEKKHLLEMKDGMVEAIIDTQNGTYFDPEVNDWKKITEPNQEEK